MLLTTRVSSDIRSLDKPCVEWHFKTRRVATDCFVSAAVAVLILILKISSSSPRSTTRDQITGSLRALTVGEKLHAPTRERNRNLATGKLFVHRSHVITPKQVERKAINVVFNRLQDTNILFKQNGVIMHYTDVSKERFAITYETASVFFFFLILFF